MDKKSKIFFLVFFLLIVGSIGVTYYRYVVVRDYMIQAEAPCDPYTEQCFVYTCDPVAEECSGDPAEDTSYYKMITRNAKNIPLCDPNDEDCDALTCPEGEADCILTLCDSTTAAEGEVCNDPALYTQENPVIEEETGIDNVEGGSEESVSNEDAQGIEE